MNVPWSQAQWEKVLVYGLGVSGLAAVRFLLGRGVSVLGVDDRSAVDLDLGDLADEPRLDVARAAALADLPRDVDGVVISPGVARSAPLIEEALRRGTPVIGEIELAFPFVRGTLVAITGSNGKSTTTALTGSLLEGAGRDAIVCGNIGRPLIDCVDEPAEVFVAELSSFQLESVDTFRPRAAALLNLSADHLDRHGDLAGYADAKAAIFDRQAEDDVAVFNADDPLVVEISRRGGSARRRFFSRQSKVEDGCYLEDGIVVEVAPGEGKRPLFASTDVPVPGEHNLENAMAGALLARAVGLEPGQLSAGLAAFEGLPHRVERVADRQGVVWYDDSKGTNIGATLKSLEGFADGTVHLILGGRNKGGDAADLSDVVARKASRLYFIGEAAAEFEAALGGFVPCQQSGTLETAVAEAARLAGDGEIVLLSPACASFDQYENFARRGDHFQSLVHGLEEVPNG